MVFHKKAPSLIGEKYYIEEYVHCIVKQSIDG